MGATKTLLTLEEFARLPDAENGLAQELDEGELIRMTVPKPRHNRVRNRIYQNFVDYLRIHPVGEVFIEEGFVLSEEPATLRIPDVSFLRRERAVAGNLDEWFVGAPDLAIEVASPGDTPPDLLRRVSQYLKAGSRVVWVVYPTAREVHVFEASGAVRVLRSGESLEAPELLPGFSLPLDELFA
jgi:Uma2 family endonuclease